MAKYTEPPTYALWDGKRQRLYAVSDLPFTTKRKLKAELTRLHVGEGWEVVEASELLSSLSTNAVEPPIDIVNELRTNTASPHPFPSRSIDSIEIITIHHSGSTDREHTSIEAWHRYHSNPRGKNWPRVGYHFAIGFYDGVMGLYQLNPLDKITWHDSKNTKSVGVVIAGDLRAGEDERPTAEQSDLFGQWIAWIIPQLPNLTYIVSHKQCQRTACPGQIRVWGNDLVQSAFNHGQDVSTMWMKSLPVRVRVAEWLNRTGPPMGDYNDV